VSRSAKEVERWLSAGEAGHKLGTSGTWVTRLAREGRIDGIHTSLGWLVDPKSVDKEARRRSQRRRRRAADNGRGQERLIK
jgi:hypothetical protein